MTNSKNRDYVKSFTNKLNGVTYNSLRYKSFPSVSLPNGPRKSRVVQQAARAALEAYQAQEAEQPAVAKKVRGTTFSDGLSRYYDTPAFQALRKSTQADRRNVLGNLCRQHGDNPLSGIERAHVRTMIAAREKTPAAARKVLIALRHFFQERVSANLLHEDKDPTLAIKLDKRVVKRFGHYKTWSHEHVEQFRAHWGLETMERLAFELMLGFGMAAADVIRFSRSWVSKTNVSFYRRRKTSTKAYPAYTPAIRDAIAACPPAGPADKPFEPVLRDQLGRTWFQVGAELPDTKDETNEDWRNQDFSQWFTKACRAAGLPAGISAHGVRKRAACDDCLKRHPAKTLMMKFGWADMDEVVLYTKEAEDELEAEARAKEAWAGEIEAAD